MNQSGSYSVSKRNGGDNQELLSEFNTHKNGGYIAAKSIKQSNYKSYHIEGQRSSADGLNLGGEFHSDKSSFLEEKSQPVKLTPAWEDDTNLSDDELNFKDFTMDRSELEIRPPKDKLNIVFLILILHGIGALTPWNMFITAKTYFVDYKLSEDYIKDNTTHYGTYFSNSVSLGSQIPNFLFSWLNVFVHFGGNLTTRVVWSIFIEVVIFVLTVVLAMVNTSAYPAAFFWTTMVSVVILNMAGGVYQNTVFGIGAKLPPDYTGAIILGTNISGTFTALINLLTSIFSPSVRTAAIYYFITALFVLLACFDTYFALPLIRFYRYQEYLAQKSEKRTKGRTIRIPYWSIFVSAFPQLFNVFFTFFVTLAIFPSMHSDIHRIDEDFIVPDKYYVSIMCFVTFNVTAMIGSLLTNWIKWPSPRYLVIPVILRVLFIPFFVFCNYRPLDVTRLLPVFITNDWVYLTGAILMGLTSGYCSSLAMMYVPRTVQSEHAATAGMFGGAILITGIFTGLLFSMVFPLAIELDIPWL